MSNCARQANGKTVYQVDKNDTWKETVPFLLEYFARWNYKSILYVTIFLHLKQKCTHLHMRQDNERNATN